MEFLNRKLNKSINLFSVILTLINFTEVMKMVLYFSWFRILSHLTIWSFILSSTYLILTLITDINFYLFKSTKLEKFNSFLRNHFSQIAYPFCYLITFEFWFFLFLGLLIANKNPFTEGNKKITGSFLYDVFYLHFGITIIMILHLFVTKRENIKISNNTIIANNLILFFYVADVIIWNYVIKRHAYPFMKSAGVGFIIGLIIFTFVFLNIFHFIHIKVINAINNKKFKLE